MEKTEKWKFPHRDERFMAKARLATTAGAAALTMSLNPSPPPEADVSVIAHTIEHFDTSDLVNAVAEPMEIVEIEKPDPVEIEQTIGELKSKRTWAHEIPSDRKAEDDKIEQDVLIERMKLVEPTPEGYAESISSIDTSMAGTFQRAGLLHKRGVIEDPDYFVWHHTASGYKEDVRGMVTSLVNSRHASVHWAIGRDARIYQLATHPKQAMWHASGLHEISTGVEILSDKTRAQGSVTEKQLEAAIYLTYHVITDVYGYSPDRIPDAVIGHREANDRYNIGNNGKPDFFKREMRGAIVPKIMDFAEAMEESTLQAKNSLLD